MVGFVGTIASVIAIPLAFYLSFASRSTRELTITSDPPVAVVRAGQMSSVDILYHGERITTDVYARQVYMWNAGTDSIRGEQILEPIVISIPHGKILEARVKKVSRGLIGILVTGAGIAGSDDRVRLSWNILEHNDGVVLDLIYAAPDASKLIAVGTIEHQSGLRVREYENSRETVLQGWGLVTARVLLGVLSILMVVVGIGMGASGLQTKRQRKLAVKEIFAICFLCIFFTGAGSALMWLILSTWGVEVAPPIF
jgi:hypothetical protein